jgi:hypothetical protein
MNVRLWHLQIAMAVVATTTVLQWQGWIGPTKLAAGQAALGCCTPYKSIMNIFGASSGFGVDGDGDQAGSCFDLTGGVQQQTS